MISKVKFTLKHPFLVSSCLLNRDRSPIVARRIIDTAQQLQKANPGVRTVLEDMEEYLGLPRYLVALNMTMGVPLVARRWERENPQTPEQVRDFYQCCSEYLYDLAYWNLMNPSYQQLLGLISTRPHGTCLSFGGGLRLRPLPWLPRETRSGTAISPAHQYGNLRSGGRSGPVRQSNSLQRYQKRCLSIVWWPSTSLSTSLTPN